MNRLFEALSEMEMLQPAPAAASRPAVPKAAAEVVSEADPGLGALIVVPQQPESEEPPSPRSSVIEFPQPDMTALIPELPADEVENGVSPLLEETFPNDLASLITVLQAEMDEMAAGPVPPVTAEEPALVRIPEFECPALAAEYVQPEPSDMEMNAPILLEFVGSESSVAKGASEDASSLEEEVSATPPSPCVEGPQIEPHIAAADLAPTDAHLDWLPQDEVSHSFDEGLSADAFPFGMAPLVLVLEPEIQQMELNFSVAAHPAAGETREGHPRETEGQAAAAGPASVAMPAEESKRSAMVEESAPAAENAQPQEEPAVGSRARAIPQGETAAARGVLVKIRPESRLVALSDPNSLGAEKFRALVARLEHQHRQCGLRSFQVTSSVISEGKTLVSGNIALTLARHLGAKTLLVEGDLHRPTLASLFGLERMSGLNHWWSGRNRDLSHYVHQLEDMPLWFLPAGKPCERPSDVLRSERFVNAFEQLAGEFEWIVVDSTPMVPIVDVNLWSRIVDGTLLVAREGVTPVKALKQGLLALDQPNLIGMVFNDASSTTHSKYDGQYYGTPKRGK